MKLLKEANHTVLMGLGVILPSGYYEACLPWSLLGHFAPECNASVALNVLCVPFLQGVSIFDK